MMSAICERAYLDAIKHQKAILKFISANDVDLTGGHQSGFFLPKSVWGLFSPYAPNKGELNKNPVTITWQDGRKTHSIITWYGKGTRSEYRLTGGLSHDFPFRTFDNLGDLLVLIPTSENKSTFNAYVLDLDEDIEEIQINLGVQIIKSWVAYETGREHAQTENECLNQRFRDFAQMVEKLPGGNVFSNATLDAIRSCVPNFGKQTSDEQLIKLIDEEYNLYKMVERKVYAPEVNRLFGSIDDFLKTALSILQARKSRAGRSLENHVEFLLKNSGVPFEMRQTVDDTRPDIIIPGRNAYYDSAFPSRKLFMVGLKTTCKDRWRQVTNEAPRIKRKHILTLQEGISSKQLDEMNRANVALIVPASRHKEYPKEKRADLLSVNQFIEMLKTTFSET